MKFHVNKIILWMKNGNIRDDLDFKPNKVNIITGDSNTGKSALFYIFDYVFLSSDISKIPSEVIDENIDWYGINFTINDKKYTIARKSFGIDKKPSNEFYFSGSGQIPDKPYNSIGKTQLKKIIENEFSIDDNVVIPYGGKKIKQGSKISFRYFLLFTTQGENVIINSDTFFDKQNDTKYKEALHRIFDLAIGIDNVKDTLIREKIIKLEKEINRLEKKQKTIDNQNLLFEKEMLSIVRKAKEYGLIENTSNEISKSIDSLKKIIAFEEEICDNSELNKLETLKTKKMEINRKIRNLNKFERDYKNYKNVIKENYDSLKPIKHIKDNYFDLLDVPLLKEFVDVLSDELRSLKKALNQKSPINSDVKEEIKKLTSELKEINKEIDTYPQIDRVFEGAINKYIFLGEIKNKIATYEKKLPEEDYSVLIEQQKEECNLLEDQLGNRENKREATIRLLEDYINVYLKRSSKALENYAEYRAAFDYKEKKLQLQKPRTTEVTNSIGSSSNQLFLHLTMFLGLHELFISQNIPFVPPFLFLDQPSRPYYDNDRKEATDREKITIAMMLLNDFITRINDEYGREYQFIVLEHIPQDIWEESNLENIHLVAEFFGTKLIREEDKI